MKRFTLFSLIILYCSNAISREYHYSKPQTPFQSPNSLPSPATTKHLIKTLGPNGRVYEVHTTPSQSVYEGVQSPQYQAGAAPSTRYLAPTAGQQNFNGATPITTIYVQHVAAGRAQSGAVPAANLQQSYNTNPLTQSLNYARPASVGSGAFAQPGAYSSAGTNYATQSYSNAVSSYTGSTATGARYSQPGASYIPPNGAGGVGVLGGNNAAYYAGGANAAAYSGAHKSQASYTLAGSPYTTQPGFNGNYISQSEGSRLAVYPYSQENGDSRPFPRQITTCDPSGRCQTINLGPNEVDPTHQHFVAVSRAHAQPVSDKCLRIKAAQQQLLQQQQQFGGAAQLGGQIGAPRGKAGALYETYLPKRQKGRRLFPYSEVADSDDYN